jgi:hypothetical protein
MLRLYKCIAFVTPTGVIIIEYVIGSAVSAVSPFKVSAVSAVSAVSPFKVILYYFKNRLRQLALFFYWW